VVVVGLALVDGATRSSGGASSSPSSSLATGSQGLSGYTELLRRFGYRVRAARGSLSDQTLDPRATLVVLDPELVDGADARAMRRFVDAGGTLIAGGTNSTRWVRAAFADAPSWSSNGATDLESLEPRVLPGISSVQAAGTGSWSGAHEPLLVADHVVVLDRIERGTATALARTRDPMRALAPLQEATRARLATRAGLAPDADDDDLRAVARRAGWPDDEIASLFDPLDDDAGVLAAGRALARAEKGEW